MSKMHHSLCPAHKEQLDIHDFPYLVQQRSTTRPRTYHIMSSMNRNYLSHVGKSFNLSTEGQQIIHKPMAILVSHDRIARTNIICLTHVEKSQKNDYPFSSIPQTISLATTPPLQHFQ